MPVKIQVVVIALASLALAACNPNLKAEKLALARLAEQEAAVFKLLSECSEKFGLDRIEKDEKAAAATCKPLRDATAAFIGTQITDGNRRAALAAFERERSDPSCQEETRLRDLWLQRSSDAERCREHDERTREFEMRKADVAACLKCAIKERCEKLMAGNLTAYIATHNLIPVEPRPEEREAFETWKAEHSTISYACER